MITFNEQVTTLIGNMVSKQISDYVAEIEQAYAAADGPLTLSVRIKFSPHQTVDGRDLAIETGLSFVSGRVKDKSRQIVNPNQPKLI